jgi:hypothetical protein
LTNNLVYTLLSSSSVDSWCLRKKLYQFTIFGGKFRSPIAFIADLNERLLKAPAISKTTPILECIVVLAGLIRFCLQPHLGLYMYLYPCEKRVVRSLMAF